MIIWGSIKTLIERIPCRVYSFQLTLTSSKHSRRQYFQVRNAQNINKEERNRQESKSLKMQTIKTKTKQMQIKNLKYLLHPAIKIFFFCFFPLNLGLSELHEWHS